MKQSKIIIIIGVIVIIAVVAFMAIDFFVGINRPHRNVYEYKLDKLKEVDSSLIDYSEILHFKVDMEKMKSVAVDENDNIYVVGKNSLLVFDKTGKLIKDFITDTEALSVAVNKENEIFIGAVNHIEVWTEDGKLKKKWEIINDRALITSIATKDNSVFVADAGNKIIYHFDNDGNFIDNFGREDPTKGIQGFIIPSPYFDLAIGRDGELWAVNSGRHQLESYDDNGNLISSWKKTSMGLDGFSGCCNPSNIAILSNGSFVTSEKGIVRIKIHEPSGEFKSVVAAPNQFEKGTKGLDLAVDSKDRIVVLDPLRGLIRIFKKQ